MNVIPFAFENLEVRTLADEKGDVWFVANDICNVLGYVNTSQAVKKNCREGGISKRYTPSESGEQEMLLINEGNLYRLIIKSRRPEAEAFEQWVMDEVLPSIRKTGAFSAPGFSTEELLATNRDLAAELSRLQILHYNLKPLATPEMLTAPPPKPKAPPVVINRELRLKALFDVLNVRNVTNVQFGLETGLDPMVIHRDALSIPSADLVLITSVPGTANTYHYGWAKADWLVCNGGSGVQAKVRTLEGY